MEPIGIVDDLERLRVPERPQQQGLGARPLGAPVLADVRERVGVPFQGRGRLREAAEPAVDRPERVMVFRAAAGGDRRLHLDQRLRGPVAGRQAAGKAVARVRTRWVRGQDVAVHPLRLVEQAGRPERVGLQCSYFRVRGPQLVQEHGLLIRAVELGDGHRRPQQPDGRAQQLRRLGARLGQLVGRERLPVAFVLEQKVPELELQLAARGIRRGLGPGDNRHAGRKQQETQRMP